METFSRLETPAGQHALKCLLLKVCRSLNNVTVQLVKIASRANDTFVWSSYVCIQLFRERLSEKVHATISKGIVGGFEFAVFQRNLKEWHEKPRTYVCAF